MEAKFIYENLNESKFVSKFRPKMNVKTKDNEYHIIKVEDHSQKYDLIYVIDKHEKKKMIASDWLEENGTIIPIEREKRKLEPKEPSMTTREYIREIKDAIDGLKQTIDDDEDPGSYIYDSAESMIYDPKLLNYLQKKYKKEYGQITNRESELIEILANDMSNNYYK